MIETMILSELDEAEKKFKPFNSGHEGYAIIKEEVEELEEKVERLNEYLEELWKSIKNNNNCFTNNNFLNLKGFSIEAIKEAIQVAAMCKRFQKDLGVINNG